MAYFYRSSRASGKIIHYLPKEIFLQFNYVQLECLKINTLDKPQLKVCLMLVIGMITDLTPLPLSLEEEDHQVVVLDTSVPLSDKQMAFLENHCNLLQGNGRSDENTYLSCLRILCSLIHRMYV